jgi:hypothetical protein
MEATVTLQLFQPFLDKHSLLSAVLHFIKGTVSRDFRLSGFFFINQPHIGP